MGIDKPVDICGIIIDKLVDKCGIIYHVICKNFNVQYSTMAVRTHKKRLKFGIEEKPS